jgi:septal ring factor EnvC (AmiA/AmiB activator)
MAELEFKEEHIKMLSDHEARLKTVENKVDDISDIKENLKILTVLQQKQEERDLKFDKNYEEQIKTNAEITSALKCVNASLENLNNEIKETNCKVTSLEGKFYKAEELNKIDLRCVEKEKVKETLMTKVKKAAIPFAAISALLVSLFELIKGIISSK